MTDKNAVIEKLNDVKKEISALRVQCQSKSFYFDGFWENDDYRNIKNLSTFLTAQDALRERISTTIIGSVREKGSLEAAAPYIADCILRAWNETMDGLSNELGAPLESLIEEAGPEMHKIIKKIQILDTKLNRICLEEILNGQ